MAPRPASAYAAFRATRHFGSLDGLRCLSIVAVILRHGPPKLVPYIAQKGFYGVDLFFAISGFLITTLLLRERERHGKISLRNFYIRRTLRIFPLYFTVLGAHVVLISFYKEPVIRQDFFHNLPFFLTYTANWFVPTTSLFGFAWSLAAEEQFYCVWPWFERFFRGHRPVWIMVGIGTTVVAAVTVRAQLGWNGVEGPLLLRIVAGIPTAICAGVLIAHWLHSGAGFEVAWRLLGSRPTAALALIVALALVLGGVHRAAVGPAMAVLVAACVIREDHILSPFLRHPAIAHVGVVSYGIYLMHLLCFAAINRAVRPLGIDLDSAPVTMFVTTVLGSIAVASLSFRFYERPFLRLKDRLTSDSLS